MGMRPSEATGTRSTGGKNTAGGPTSDGKQSDETNAPGTGTWFARGVAVSLALAQLFA